MNGRRSIVASFAIVIVLLVAGCSSSAALTADDLRGHTLEEVQELTRESQIFVVDVSAPEASAPSYSPNDAPDDWKVVAACKTSNESGDTWNVGVIPLKGTDADQEQALSDDAYDDSLASHCS